METWVLGAILTLVGFLVIGCSFGHSELGFSFIAGGIASATAGTLICLTNFKKWVANI